MKIITQDTPLHHRRTILVADVTTLARYQKDNAKLKIKFPVLYPIGSLIMPFGVALAEAGSELLEMLSIKKLQNLSMGEIDYCAENFNFPPQHPANGVVYSCPDYQSDFYIPVANFHDYTFQLKMSAFVELCSSLGAKKCSVLYAEENGKQISINSSASEIFTPTGAATAKLEFGKSHKNETTFNSEYDFPKPKEIKEFLSKWVTSEPSWATLQRIRINNGITKSRVEINYSDEMGINAEFAGKLNRIGVNIGGKFNEIKKKKYVYEVEFWDMN